MKSLSNALRKVIRGESHWSTLNEFGVDVRRFGERWEFGAYPGEAIELNSYDVEEGIRNLKHDESKLIEWASFILAASDLIDMDHFGDSSPKLLDYLWDLSAGKIDHR